MAKRTEELVRTRIAKRILNTKTNWSESEETSRKPLGQIRSYDLLKLLQNASGKVAKPRELVAA